MLSGASWVWFQQTARGREWPCEQDEEGQEEPESMAGYPRKPLAVS